LFRGGGCAWRAGDFGPGVPEGLPSCRRVVSSASGHLTV
jgi:hypothetical protein